MTKFQLKISNPSIHGVTGHHTVNAVIVESTLDGDLTGTVHGVPETHGIDSMALQTKYDGDVHKWLADIGKEMLERHHQRNAAQTELLAMDGKTLELEEIP
jgi:hypothetical protein